ncbi:MAG: DUF4358 domain-containing protein [Oscillospiraceae bacterium]|nr:DUF4358 domain-containing protein [Oscillospiraceae bacterium]
MKKKILIALCAAFCLALCGCDGGDDTKNNSGSSSSVNSEKDPSDNNNSSETASVKNKAEQLLDEVDFPSMVEVKEDKLEIYFGINKDDVSEFAAYICGSGAAPDEFGIFKAKDAESAANIKAALDKRVQSQYDLFSSYTPDAMYRFDDDFVEVSGTTVIYAICDNNEKAKEILK